MRILETPVYQFDELSERAQDKALESLSQINVEFDEWYGTVYSDFVTIAEMIGVEFDTRTVQLVNGKTRGEPKIWFSGFSSQGDGACFEGTYRYKKGALRAVREYAPKDAELHAIVRDLQAAQRGCFYSAVAHITHRGHYYHSGCVTIEVSAEDANGRDVMTADTEDGIASSLRALMDWLYSRLSAEYDYLTGREAVKEAIEANAYEFTEDGDLA